MYWQNACVCVLLLLFGVLQLIGVLLIQLVVAHCSTATSNAVAAYLLVCLHHQQQQARKQQFSGKTRLAVDNRRRKLRLLRVFRHVDFHCLPPPSPLQSGSSGRERGDGS